jgi:hypothetical protein
MEATVVSKYDGKFLLYNRMSKKLLFSDIRRDTKMYLTVGMVWAGEVAGKPVTYWLQQIGKDNKEE